MEIQIRGWLWCSQTESFMTSQTEKEAGQGLTTPLTGPKAKGEREDRSDGEPGWRRHEQTA